MKKTSKKSNFAPMLSIAVVITTIAMLIWWAIGKHIEEKTIAEKVKIDYEKISSQKEYIIISKIEPIYDKLWQIGYVKMHNPKVYDNNGYLVENTDSILLLFDMSFHEKKGVYYFVPTLNFDDFQYFKIDEVKIDFKNKKEKYYRHNIIVLEENGIPYVSDWSKYKF